MIVWVNSSFIHHLINSYLLRLGVILIFLESVKFIEAEAWTNDLRWLGS